MKKTKEENNCRACGKKLYKRKRYCAECKKEIPYRASIKSGEESYVPPFDRRKEYDARKRFIGV